MNAVRDAMLRRGAPDPIPITLLTGFLGAGKTTLLNRLVRSPEFAGAAVIVNELGEISIDHLLVETTGSGLLTLSSGCICCTVRGDLVTTLEDLLRRRDNDRTAPFDRVVIETTGLADPAPVLNAIVMHPYLMLRYRIDGVITVVDALNGVASLDARPESVGQVAIADALVLTKTDLEAAASHSTAQLRERLAYLNPLADMVDATAVTSSALLTASLFRNAGRLQSAAGTHDHHHHDHDGPGHRHGIHDAGIAAFALKAEAPLEPVAFDMFLDLLRSTHGSALLRVKGLVSLADDPMRPLLVQAVRHFAHPPRRLPVWPDGDHGTRLVLIGRDLDRLAIERLWTAFFGPPEIDRPDRAAFAAPFRAERGGLF